MDTKQLKCFVATAEVLHFGNAAHQLNMLPTTLGRQIKLLEESLGVRLFVRSTRHVTLTAAGNMLYRDAKLILNKSRRPSSACASCPRPRGQAAHRRHRQRRGQPAAAGALRVS